MSSIKEVCKKIKKQYNSNNLIITGDIVPDYQRLPLDSLGFSYPLYGGLPLGRIVTFAGKEHSGKTTAACLAIAAYQKHFPEQTCVYVDVEHSLDLKFQAKMTGMQLDKLYYISPETLSGEQILDMIIELQQTDDVGMIVLDSIPALVSGKEMENDITKDLGRSGNMARPLHRFTKLMADLVSLKNNIFIFVNQVRVSGTTFTGATIYSEPGGDAAKYYSSVKIRLGTRTFIKGDRTDLSDGTDAEGFRLKFAITKNKTADIRRSGGFCSFNYETGVDYIRDALEIALAFDYIYRPTSMTYVLKNLETDEVYTDENGEELKFVGKPKLITYFKEHPDFAREYVDMLTRFITESNSSASLLDEESLQHIKEEETKVNGE